MAAQGNAEGGWPGGWLVALVAGVVAAVLALWLGNVGLAVAVLVGIFVFLVFGILLGMFWAAPATGDHAGHDHGGQGEGGHAPAEKAAPAAPVVAATVPPLVDAPRSVAPVAAAPEPVAAPAPVVAVSSAKPVPVAAPSEGAVKPTGLWAARGGVADKLQTIEGIGPVLERMCHDLGIYHFDQIAGWGGAEVAWMDGNLKGFKGRVTRDKWVAQARLIGDVGIAAFRARAKTNDY